jgi:protein-S-isoprenylcysteine O-methyltransferase Ste14
MPVAALIIYLLWFALTGVMRAVISHRTTGDSGWRGFSGPPWSIGWFANIGFGGALVLGIISPVATLLGLDPLVDAPITAAVGLVIAVLGVATTLLAQLAMGSSWRVGVDTTERTDLVHGGPFALVRNPIFTAMIATMAGLVLMVPNVIAIAALITLVTSFEVHVRLIEEPYLLTTHGEAYVDYAGRVGRFVPGIGRLAIS